MIKISISPNCFLYFTKFFNIFSHKNKQSQLINFNKTQKTSNTISFIPKNKAFDFLSSQNKLLSCSYQILLLRVLFQHKVQQSPISERN